MILEHAHVEFCKGKKGMVFTVRLSFFFLKMCDINPCLHGGTCADTCKDPFYACGCRSTYFEGPICEKNSSKSRQVFISQRALFRGSVAQSSKRRPPSELYIYR